MSRFWGPPTSQVILPCSLHLVQELVGLPEGYYYEFRLFTGETIKLDYDGKFYIDGALCSGAAFTGVDNC